MSKIRFPYGKKFIEYDIPDNRENGVLESSIKEYTPGKTGDELVEEALRSPHGGKSLSDLSKEKNKIVIIASDHTRPVPSKIIIPKMLREIRKGNKNADITILIATGCHRETSEEELIDKFGEEVFHSEKILVHNCDDKDNLVNIGTLPSGGSLVINRLAAEADLLISEGFIEPHFFAGFSGGRKSVLPGICSRNTVMYNHNSKFIDSPYSRTGILENNPINKDMEYAAKQAKLAFIVNVVLNPDKKVIYAVSGDPFEAHKKGCEFINSLCRCNPIESDIVITTNGGYPLDQNIYQAVKGMTAAEATVKTGGVIIMLAKSDDGDGGKVFHNTFKNQQDNRILMDMFLETPPEKTIPDQWQSQIFARILMKATIIYVSDADNQTVKDLHMIPAADISDALSIADEILFKKGKRNGSILAVPDGVSVIINN